MTEDEIVGWHHGLDRHEFEQTLRVGDGPSLSLACCSPLGHKELDMTERLNRTRLFLLTDIVTIFKKLLHIYLMNTQKTNENKTKS